MKKARHQKRPHFPFCIVIVVLFILIIIIESLFLFIRYPKENNEDHFQENSIVENSNNSIAIPGYEGSTLKANSKKQDLSLKNPAENNCYFIITLYLEDGTELWKSDYIKAGDISKPIKLNQELSAGNYSAKLKYECFALNKEKTPLNGAEINLTLRVK